MIKDLLPEIEKIILKYKTRESSILAVLNFLQEKKGHISEETERDVANLLNVPLVRVHEVVTFYTMYFLNPKGRYLIQVCKSISCSIMGSETIVGFIKNKLKINVKETTNDKKFTLVEVECLGSCGKAPAMRINNTYYEDLTYEKVNKILDGLK